MNIPGHEIVIRRDPVSSVTHVRFTSGHLLNPLTRGVVTDLLSAIREISAGEPPVITFQGGENFSCGAHKGELAAMSKAQLSAFIDDELELCDLIAHLPAVTIAAIQGAYIGNAADLGLSCDLRVACDGAVFAWPEVIIGYPAPVERLASYVAEPARFEACVSGLAERAAGLPRSAVAETKKRLDAAFT